MPSTELAKVLVVLTLIGLIPVSATAKSRKPASKPVSKPRFVFIEEQPKFDTSVLPKRSRFELNVKHTDILYPANPAVLLHQTAKMVDLRGELKDSVLRGHVTEANSPIRTAEHGIKSVFNNDLFALIPKLAPDLSRQLESQIEKSQKRLAAEIARDQPLMQQQLARRPIAAMPIPMLPGSANMPSSPVYPANAAVPSIPLQGRLPTNAMPSNTVPANRAPNLSSQINAERARQQSGMQPTLKQASSQMQDALARGRGGVGSGNLQLPPGGAGSGIMPPGNMPPGIMPIASMPPVGVMPLSAIPANSPQAHMPTTIVTPVARIPDTQIEVAVLPGPQSNSDLTGKLRRAEQQIQAQLGAAGRLNAANNEVTAQLARARQIELAATPQLNAIMTHVRRLPTADVEALTAVAKMGQGAGDRTILWDAWHARFAKLAHDPLLKAFKSAGGPAGSNTVSITVTADSAVKVSLTKSSNPNFDKAVVQAYQSLNKNPGLTYPAGSMRRSVTFLVDNDHKTEGTASSVNSQTSIGDKEVHKR